MKRMSKNMQNGLFSAGFIQVFKMLRCLAITTEAYTLYKRFVAFLFYLRKPVSYNYAAAPLSNQLFKCRRAFSMEKLSHTFDTVTWRHSWDRALSQFFFFKSFFLSKWEGKIVAIKSSTMTVRQGRCRETPSQYNQEAFAFCSIIHGDGSIVSLVKWCRSPPWENETTTQTKMKLACFSSTGKVRS